MLHQSTAGLANSLSLIGRSSTRSALYKVKSLSHDIASPLTAIKLNLNMLESSASRKKVVLKRIYQGIDHIERIIEQELNHSDNNPWNICDVINEVIALHNLELKKQGILLNKLYFANKTFSNVPAVVFFRIINNLLSNAITAVSEQPTNRRIWVAVHENGDHFIVTIRDNGPGVSPKMQEKLFKCQMSTNDNGHGLGLVGAYNSLQAYFHADIKYRDNDLIGHGAVFEIVFKS